MGMRGALLAALVLLGVHGGAASAQDWPARPVTMVVPTAAGGGTDILARMLAPRLSELLGQPVIIENVGHAPSAAARVARAAPDGYRIAFGSLATHAFTPNLYKRPLYDPIGDFEPVGLILEQPYFLVARNSLPVNGLREFADYARANGAEMRYGSGAGAGSGNHIVCELVNAALGIKIAHIPYRDIGPLTQDMIAGRVDYQCPLPGTMIPLIQTKQVKGLAVLGRARSVHLPDLPTAEEQGIDVQGVNWNALFLPKGASPDIVRKLNAAAIAALDTKEVQDRLTTVSAVVVAKERRSPDYLRRFVESEIQKWAPPIKASGASVD